MQIHSWTTCLNFIGFSLPNLFWSVEFAKLWTWVRSYHSTRQLDTQIRIQYITILRQNSTIVKQVIFSYISNIFGYITMWHSLNDLLNQNL